MIQVEVTFTVELDAVECRALRYVIDGFSDAQIANYMHIPLGVIEKNFSNWRLENTLNLIQATRDRLVQWNPLRPTPLPKETRTA